MRRAAVRVRTSLFSNCYSLTRRRWGMREGMSGLEGPIPLEADCDDDVFLVPAAAPSVRSMSVTHERCVPWVVCGMMHQAALCAARPGEGRPA